MPEHVPLQGDLGEYQSFLRSHIWSDLKGEITRWLEDIHNQLESDETVELCDIYRLQGAAKACRNMLMFPEIVISAYNSNRM